MKIAFSHEPKAAEERVSQLLGAHWAGTDPVAIRKVAEAFEPDRQ